jgi:hypothetical protein
MTIKDETTLITEISDVLSDMDDEEILKVYHELVPGTHDWRLDEEEWCFVMPGTKRIKDVCEAQREIEEHIESLYDENLLRVHRQLVSGTGHWVCSGGGLYEEAAYLFPTMHIIPPEQAAQTIRLLQERYDLVKVVITGEDGRPRLQRISVSELLESLDGIEPDLYWAIVNTAEGYQAPVMRIGLARNRRGELALNLVVDTFWATDVDDEEDEPEITPDPTWQISGF